MEFIISLKSGDKFVVTVPGGLAEILEAMKHATQEAPQANKNFLVIGGVMYDIQEVAAIYPLSQRCG